MSAFLGPIHHWLYNKILWHESLLEDIYSEVTGHESKIAEIRASNESRFGMPVSGALESIIDTDNIHGWLQRQIESVEYRMANTITFLLEAQLLTEVELTALYKRDGEKAAQQIDPSMHRADALFKLLFDFLLDGMPCDRVNNPIEGNEAHYTWMKRMCIHKPYWDAVGGDIAVFDSLRHSWMSAFLPKTFIFNQLDEVTFEIRRV